MGTRINTIMQTCFFAISGVLPRDEAIAHIKKAIEKTYGKRGPEVVRRNCEAVDQTLAHLHEIAVPASATATRARPPLVSEQRARLRAEGDRGDARRQGRPAAGQRVPGRRHLADRRRRSGRSATSRSRSRSGTRRSASSATSARWSARTRPSAPRSTTPSALAGAPPTFKSTPFKGHGAQGQALHDPGRARGLHRLQPLRQGLPGQGPAPTRSTRRSTCTPQAPLREAERDELRLLPRPARARPRRDVRSSIIKGSQFLEPLFEYSGACAGCGETPYLKLLTQLFGDRLLIANATGCSSIYGGNLPTTPYTTNRDGRGPAWSNSLFEDNAEFGFGMRLALDAHAAPARGARPAARRRSSATGWPTALLDADQSSEAGIAAQRERVAALRQKLAGVDSSPRRAACETLADYLVKKSVWIVGGDGWAYDIGYGGLDHVLASRRNVNILVLDTEVYSNTGGQAVEGDAARRGRQVRRRRQAGRQEGSRPDGDMLRPRLRRAGSPSAPRWRRR